MVYHEKFAGMFSENLVNMSYISKKAKEYKLQLIEYKPFMEEPGNLLSQFSSESDESRKYAKTINDTPALITWERLQSYFIFQKIRDN